jgi:membrane bound O-acyltransferase family protein
MRSSSVGAQEKRGNVLRAAPADTDGSARIGTLVRGHSAWFGRAPLIVLPTLAISFGSTFAPWVFMWVLAASIFFGCKWQSWWERPNGRDIPAGRSIGYLLAWPGMDAALFLDASKRPAEIKPKEWFWAVAKTACGITLVWAAARHAVTGGSLLVGWTGMLGLILVLHFGTFHVLSLLWRAAGVDAQPIMQAPLCASSLSDFWGRRWNLGFRQLTYRLIFAPVRSRLGSSAAMLLSFFASGLIHELVISLPARGGYGLPTGYFILQGLGLAFERSPLGRILGIGSEVRGWLFVLVCAGGPAYFLLHPLFVHRVILPFLTTLGGK